MIRYTLYPGKPNTHYINIEARFETLGANELAIQLPAWRPGRYELANFAQNIRQWNVSDENGNRLQNRKLTKDAWAVKTNGCKEVIVQYDYYANLLDAGNTYIDENQLYVNPVNCLVYLPGRMQEPCEITLTGLSNAWKVASALVFDESKKAVAADFDTLADSPFMASEHLLHHQYQTQDNHFHIWALGTPRADWKRIVKDFEAFSAKQIELFGEMPVSHYHFLYQMPDYKYYHGVEHLASTVICFGPSGSLMSDLQYVDFLGISSHELFHCWNVKSIRPQEMHPYDYTRENYTVLNYVTEGVTSYYGDLMLFRAGVYDWETYSVKTAKTIERYQHNFGRLYQSLAEASWDSWLDGYKGGAPERKISFYQKGAIVAWMIDLALRLNQSGNSLDTVMHQLYYSFAKKDKGYSEADYINLITSLGMQDCTAFFEKFVWGLDDIENPLNQLLESIGCELVAKENPLYFEDKLGFRMLDMEITGKNTITHIAPGGPADEADLGIGDEIVAVNGAIADKNLHDAMRKHRGSPIELTIVRNRKLATAVLTENSKNLYPLYQIAKLGSADQKQKSNFENWSHQKF